VITGLSKEITPILQELDAQQRCSNSKQKIGQQTLLSFGNIDSQA
jgi:hypothetical protein